MADDGWPRVVLLAPDPTRPSLRVELPGDCGLELAAVIPGESFGGRPADETGRDTDRPPGRISVPQPIHIGRREVTQSQWAAVMGRNPARFTEAGLEAPVERVSWDDCQAFLAKLGPGFRLPTEDEWEYACRAGTETAFHTGAGLDAAMANFDGSHPYGPNARRGVYRQTTMPTGSFPPNAWGLHDMHGNVWEWCDDPYQDWTGGRPVGAPADGGRRVLRGGSWASIGEYCRSAKRTGLARTARQDNVGFRVVFDAALAAASGRPIHSGLP